MQILLFAVSLLLVSAVAQNTSFGSDDIWDRLIEVAEEEFGRYGTTSIPEPFRGEISLFIDAGINQLLEDGASLELVIRAEDNLRLLIRENLIPLYLSQEGGIIVDMQAFVDGFDDAVAMMSDSETGSIGFAGLGESDALLVLILNRLSEIEQRIGELENGPTDSVEPASKSEAQEQDFSEQNRQQRDEVESIGSLIPEREDSSNMREYIKSVLKARCLYPFCP